jgi:phosphate:Na+ symporter
MQGLLLNHKPYWPYVLLLAMFTSSAWAAAAVDDSSIDWFQLIMGLFGGLALFLSGLELLSDGLKKAAGQTLKNVLSKLTTNRFMGAITGAFVTGVLNSSSVTTVLVVGFVTAGAMSLSQSVGVIMGANIGSTVTAQLLAFNLAAYALLPIAIGFFMMFAAKQERLKYYGMMIMGLGLVFFGMGIMSDAMNPLRTYEPFMEFLKSMEKPVLGILAGALFTALVQSSAATVGIAIAMASEGLLSLPAGIALALGANIGTCITALMAALGKPTEAVRAAVVHVLFNVAGVLIWLAFIPYLADIAIAISPAFPDLAGMEKAAAEVPRQVANANTFFNIANTIIFIGFTGLFALAAEKMVKSKEEGAEIIIEPLYLDADAVKAPSLALENVRMEFARTGEIAISMYDDLKLAIKDRNRAHLQSIAQRDDQIDLLEAKTLEYLATIRQASLTEEEGFTHQQLMTAIVNLESLADLIETDLVNLANEYFIQDAIISDETRQLLLSLYEDVGNAVRLSIEAIQSDNPVKAETVVNMQPEIDRNVSVFLNRKSADIAKDEPDYLRNVRLQMSFVDKIRRIYSLSKRIARVVLPETLLRDH